MSPSFRVPSLSLPPEQADVQTRWHIPCNPAAIPPLSGIGSSSDKPAVPCPYQSTELLVLMQTTHPPVFTQLFAVSCVSGYQHGPFLYPWLQHSSWCFTCPFPSPNIYFHCRPLQLLPPAAGFLLQIAPTLLVGFKPKPARLAPVVSKRPDHL